MRILLATLAMLFAACGATAGGSAPDPAASPGPTEPTATAGPVHGDDMGQPPPFRVRYDDRELVLHPHTYCYGNGCVDGFSRDTPEIGSPEEILVHVPVREFDLEVGFNEYSPNDESNCRGRNVPGQVEDVGNGWYRVAPAGPAADYTVGLFASGNGGDMVAELRWETPTDGAMPTPSAALALLPVDVDAPGSHEILLTATDMAGTSDRARATISFTDADGAYLVVRPERTRGSCLGAGNASFDLSPKDTAAVARLRAFPVTAVVTLTLDGTSYAATVRVEEGLEAGPETLTLEFEPPLPGLS